MEFIIKRDGCIEPFDEMKIYQAVAKAAASVSTDKKRIEAIAASVKRRVMSEIGPSITKRYPSVEDVQGLVVKMLVNSREVEIAEAYIKYREKRTHQREMKSKLMETTAEITFASSVDSNLKRDNGNVNGDTPMGMMLQYGSAVAKYFTDNYLLDKDIATSVKEGEIYIHDKDFLPTGTLTCCQIPLDKLFKYGFNTGHGFIRAPQSIRSYAALAAIAIQSNQNDMHGGQSIPLFDFYLAPGITKTLKKELKTALDILFFASVQKKELKMGEILDSIEEQLYLIKNKITLKLRIKEKLVQKKIDVVKADKLVDMAYIIAIDKTEKETYQAMESLIHNLNTMHSRAGAQVPFSSINFGMDTSEEGRMVSKNLLLAQEAGLGNGETPIFPILIFQVKEGINYNPEDINYDLFQLSLRVSAKRLFPNFVFVDAPFNLQYYDPKDPETIIATMGCRTRVIGNINGKETPVGRGNLSFSTINLPRLGIKHGVLYRQQNSGNEKEAYDEEAFYQELDELIDMCIRQLLSRYELQKKKKVKNFPFLMGQKIWRGSERLDNNDELGDTIDSGTLSVGFIGLAECLIALRGGHHGESEELQNFGLEIVNHMRNKLDEATERYHLNFSLLATPAEGLSGYFTKIDREKYGEIKGITDKEYYTNSFHIPVYYHISAFDKIKKEAPYHALTNAGHITYVEVDGDLSQNIEAFEALVRCMKESGIGYGSINHPIDRDPICGYSGVISGKRCPKCGRVLETVTHEELITWQDIMQEGKE